MKVTRAYLEERTKAIMEVLDMYNDLPAYTVAKILHHNYPAYFETPEAARSLVRYWRGTNGNKNRRTLKNKKYVRQPL